MPPDRRHPRRKQAPARSQAGAGQPADRAPSTVRVRQAAPGEFELLHPRCALDRAEDLDEVCAMIEAGETEIAMDELRWLLGGCQDFIAAHRLLGELALAADDLHLARGHFGVAFQLGYKAAQNIRGSLPYSLAANQAFHEAGKGLVWSLLGLGKRELAEEVAGNLARLDPADPLEVRKLLAPSPPKPPDQQIISIRLP